MGWLMDNPIIVRELRGRMRTNRAAWLLFGYAVVLAITVGATYVSSRHDMQLLYNGELGATLFGTLAMAQGWLLCLIVPGLASGAFSGEREGQTLDALFVSPLGARALVRGKLLAATLFVLLLMTISLPLVAFCFLLGGVGAHQLVGTFAVQAASALLFAAFAVGWSLTCNSTTQATVMSYLTVGGWMSFLGSAGFQSHTVWAALPINGWREEYAWCQVAGHSVPAWLTAVLLIGVATTCVLDLTVARARLVRDGVVSMRPRLWLAGVAVALAACCAADNSGSHHWQDLCRVMLFLGALLAAVLTVGAGDVDLPRPVRWWQFWRHDPASAPLFVALLPLVALLARHHAVVTTLLAQRPDSASYHCAYSWPLVANCLMVMAAVLLAAGLVGRLMDHVVHRRWAGTFANLALLFSIGIPLMDAGDSTHKLACVVSPEMCFRGDMGASGVLVAVIFWLGVAALAAWLGRRALRPQPAG
jgi:hypothetical protein